MNANTPNTEDVRNGHTVLLRCEGMCSSAYTDDRPAWIAKMRAAGYSPEDVRGVISSAMLDRPHRHTKRVTDQTTREVALLFACNVCGHERQYGAEEL